MIRKDPIIITICLPPILLRKNPTRVPLIIYVKAIHPITKPTHITLMPFSLALRG
jgi:hypothetical protein